MKFFDRPMKFEAFLFTDIVNGKPVNLYTGKDGREWMAHSRWGLFRVERKQRPNKRELVDSNCDHEMVTTGSGTYCMKPDCDVNWK